MLARFLKDKFGWIEPDSCLWCRQTREHVFKECVAWKDGTRTLWKRVGEASIEDGKKKGLWSRRYKGRKGFCLGFMGPGNTSVKKLFRRFTEAVIDFLKTTRVGTSRAEFRKERFFYLFFLSFACLLCSECCTPWGECPAPRCLFLLYVYRWMGWGAVIGLEVITALSTYLPAPLTTHPLTTLPFSAHPFTGIINL